jgi:acyl carrier protein
MIMDAESLRARVLETLAEIAPEADLGTLDPALSFHDQMEIDSIDYLNFMLSLEKRLGIRIPEADYPKMSSLDGCLAHLEPLMAAKESADGG